MFKQKGDGGDSPNEFRENVHAYFPVLKWLYGGLITIILAFATTIYNIKMEAVELKKELEAEQQLNEQRDRKIDETYELMRQMTRQQAQMSEGIKNLNTTMERALNRMTDDLYEVRGRLNDHIDKSKV